MTTRQNWPVVALCGVVVAAVVAGMIVTGGPMQARKERRDEVRLADLNALASLVLCLAGDRGPLPTDLTGTPDCPGDLRRADPHTDAPYRYEILSPDSYRLCADFETDLILLSTWDRVNVDAASGCITGHLLRPAAAK